MGSNTRKTSNQFKILMFMGFLSFWAGFLCSCRAPKIMSKEQHPLPHAPVVVHFNDCVWIIDSDKDTVTHGPFCLDKFWQKIVIGDTEIASTGYLYISIPTKIDLEVLGGKTIVEFDPTIAKEIDKINVPPTPREMVEVNDGQLYVSTGIVRTGIQRLVVIDLNSKTVVNEILVDLPCEPRDLLLDSDGSLYLTACWSLAQIDTTTNSVSISPVEFRPNIDDMGISPSGHLYLLLHDEVRVLDPENWETIAGVSHDFSQCNSLGIAGVQGKAYITCIDMSEIMIYDIANGTVAPLPLPDRYPGIAAVSKGKVYLVQASGEKVLVLDTKSDKIVGEIPLPK